MVEINNLDFGFASPLFEGFSYSFGDSGIVAVTGGSGKGKSTLLNIIAGLIKTDAVRKDGGVAFLFQDNRLLPWLTAKQNVELLSNGADADELLSKVGLSNFKDYYPRDLSGGMQRRACFAATLAANAPIILLDEPTANLDLENAEIIRRLTKEASKKALVIIASHSEEDIAIADRVISL